jgi:O-antigen/teichoic acid export membrane protein
MARRLLLAPLGVAAVTMATFPGEILDLLYASPAETGIKAFTLLMLTLVPVGLIYIYSTILTAAGQFKLLGAITMTGMVVNIVLNRVLIPSFGAPGAALTALITQSAVALACIVAVEKRMFRITSYGRTGLYLLMLIITCAAGMILKMTGIHWVTAAAVQLAAGIALALLFRMMEPLKSLKLILERPDSI